MYWESECNTFYIVLIIICFFHNAQGQSFAVYTYIFVLTHVIWSILADMHNYTTFRD